MAVSIKVIGTDEQSDEYVIAKKLELMFLQSLPAAVTGDIVLHANATMMGQTVKDIDLLMIGKLNGYKPVLSFFNGVGEEIKAPVLIHSFCTAIEIKSHGYAGIQREGTEFLVRYGSELHSVTNQSNQQKYAVMNYIRQITNAHSPFITNLIWFIGLTNQEIDNLLRVNGARIRSNVMSADVTLEQIMQLLVWQQTPYYNNGSYRFNSYLNNAQPNEIDTVFQLFEKAKNNMGELSRKRIELITSDSIDNKIELTQTEKMVICRGRAGTGKTIGLIRLALKLVDNEDARVLMLTYNRALVADIKRQFALAELPDMFQPSCIEIMTLQSFFLKIVSSSLYNGNLQGDLFLSDYEKYLLQLKTFLQDTSGTKDLLLEELRRDASLRWDYCFVDEAQDWTALERDILFELFEKRQIVVADGGNQFVRSYEGCDWGVTKRTERETIKLKKCLRQKENLISFNNHLLKAFDYETQRISPSGNLPGGKIVICTGTQLPLNIIKRELEEVKLSGNIPYDLICFVPAHYSQNGSFIYKQLFEDEGIKIWDGTNNSVRREAPLLGESARVLHYESGRGLEAWTCICLEFDTFVSRKMVEYTEKDSVDAFLLESEEDKRKRYLTNWVLLPLTRAIDTTIMTLKNPESIISKTILSIAENHPDYVTII